MSVTKPEAERMLYLLRTAQDQWYTEARQLEAKGNWYAQILDAMAASADRTCNDLAARFMKWWGEELQPTPPPGTGA